MMTRRGVLAAAGALCAAAAAAHTPYGQWVVYRQKHLLIGAHRGDLRTYDLAKTVVAALAEELPEADARVARGPRPQRIASLMGTGQLFVAVLSSREASAMAEGAAPFEGYPPTPVHALVALDADYQLFAAPDFPEEHGLLVTQAVHHAGLGARPEGTRLHVGAAAYWG